MPRWSGNCIWDCFALGVEGWGDPRQAATPRQAVTPPDCLNFPAHTEYSAQKPQIELFQKCSFRTSAVSVSFLLCCIKVICETPPDHDL